MKTPRFLQNNIGNEHENDFKTSLILDNIRRGKILAFIVIGFETIFLTATVITAMLKVDNRFAFDAYFLMYAIMLIMNVSYLVLTKSINQDSKLSINQEKWLDAALISYITFIMSWGSVVSLMDQKLYGQIVTFMINMIVCSTVYLLEHRKIALPYIVSIVILVAGLPFFQSSMDVLIGHYVNLFFFVCVSWTTARIIYFNYTENFMSKLLIKQSNLLLEKKNEENKRINIELTNANNRLKELALLDELTGISNRRCFREFIDSVFCGRIKENTTLSIIMLDIDYFKQFNDYYGHEEGDKALVAVAHQLSSMIRSSNEIAVRWGGEEFIYAAINKSREEIAETANLIQEKVSALKIIHHDSPTNPYITVSLGISTIQISDKSQIKQAIKLADQALYKAKSSGRNCMITFNF